MSSLPHSPWSAVFTNENFLAQMAKDLATRPGSATPTNRSTTLARAVEELRQLELRMHEANASSDVFGSPSEPPAYLLDSLAMNLNAEESSSTYRAGVAEEDPPVLMEVVSLGPDIAPITGASPPTPTIAEATPESTASDESVTVRTVEDSRVTPLHRKPTLTGRAAPRLTVVRPDFQSEELSLDVADHVDSDQLCAFLGELPDLIDEMSRATRAFCTSPAQRDEGIRARNVLERLEIGADQVGVRGLATFSQHARSLLEALTTTDVEIPRSILEPLLRAEGSMRQMADVVWGQGILSDDTRDALDNLIEAELRAILDLTLRVEEPEYSVINPTSTAHRAVRSPVDAPERPALAIVQPAA
jgi:hypothetical protein